MWEDSVPRMGYVWSLSYHYFFFFNKEVVKQLLGEDSTGTVLSHKEAWQTKANDA